MTGPEPATPPAGETVPHRRRKRYAGKNPRRSGRNTRSSTRSVTPPMWPRSSPRGRPPQAVTGPSWWPKSWGARPHARRMRRGLHARFGGHTREMLARVAPGGRLVGLDVDPIELPKTTARLRAAGWVRMSLPVRSNFAALPKVLAELGLAAWTRVKNAFREGVHAEYSPQPTRRSCAPGPRSGGQPSQHLGQTPLGHSGRRQTRLNEPARLGST